MNTLNVLKAAKARLADPANWTKSAYARDGRGNPVEPDHPDACQFCPLGALIVATGAQDLSDTPVVFDEAEAALKAVVHYSVIGLNDWHKTTHADVMAMFDKAIAAEEAAPCS